MSVSAEPTRLRGWAKEILAIAGLQDADCAPVVENLAFAESRGVASHGFIRLETYVERIEAGGINGLSTPLIVDDLGSLVIMSADNGAGAATAMAAAKIAVARARTAGIGCVIARDANHFGSAAFFTDWMADQGFLGIAACNTDAVMAAPFGGKPVLGTNPLAIALPVAASVRPQLDMATTEASLGKLLVASQQGKDIPLGWAVDSNGTPTTSAAQGMVGALLPSGGPKGFGLAFMIDALLALGGARTSPSVDKLYGDPSMPQGLGHIFFALRVPDSVGAANYADAIQQLTEAVHGSSVTGAIAPMFPGEPELNRASTQGGRIPIGGQLADVLERLGQRFSRPVESAFAS